MNIETKELGPETMTLSEDEVMNENVNVDIKDEHIGETTCLILETPGGNTTIQLNGDYETNILVVDLLSEALNARYHKEPQNYASVSIYSEPCSSKSLAISETEFLGQDVKFAPNTVGAMVGLLQKSGDMNDILITKCVPSNVPIMPVKVSPGEGILALDFAEGTPI